MIAGPVDRDRPEVLRKESSMERSLREMAEDGKRRAIAAARDHVAAEDVRHALRMLDDRGVGPLPVRLSHSGNPSRGSARVMGYAEGYVVVRTFAATPFVLSIAELRAMLEALLGPARSRRDGS